MFSVVHKKKLRLCQWCGHVLKEGQDSFCIPKKSKNGTISWGRCFCAVDCATAGLKEFSDNRKLSPEDHDELVRNFRDSLYRKDAGKPSEKEPVTISAAPNPVGIVRYFGGPDTMGPEEFRKTFDPELKMRTLFGQKVKPQSDVGENSGSDGEQGDSGLKKWKTTIIPVSGSGRLGTEELSKMAQSVEPPRNIRQVVDWMLSTYTSGLNPTDGQRFFVVYTHPTTPNIFAIGSALAWTPDGTKPVKINGVAQRILTVPVAGPCLFVHRNQLKFQPIQAKPPKEKKHKTAPPLLSVSEIATATAASTTQVQTKPAPSVETIQEPIMSEPPLTEVPCSVSKIKDDRKSRKRRRLPDVSGDKK
ncbi:MAG: hypothetical protein EHM41_00920 [Chloroflexi bacterium]|nr:MAG: hypothetical protein EHM41_00920 [Chloroflexota bacterium]